MVLLFFWLKIAAKEIANLFKVSPVIVIWTLLIIAAFIVGKRDVFLALNERSLFFIVIVLLISFIMYYKKHDFFPALIFYARSSNPICVCFCKLFRNKVNKNKRIKTNKKTLYINPIIKSTISDFCTISFIQEGLISIGLFMVVIMQPVNKNTYFIILTALLSIGFMGIIDSIPHANWKFYAIVSGNNFKYHIKRTAIFLTAFFAVLLIPFLFMLSYFSLLSLLKYMFVVVVLLVLSINISFSVDNMLLKAIGMIIITGLTLWASALNVFLLLLSIIPVVLTMVRAKSEYGDWYLL
ncbi:hypothetical protein LQZ19_08225 [Treponema primitia]|uniref:hypothetical protein n=1 Tax=Treponema primitia TaxID=88058 RepID=UPI00397F7F10